MKGKSSLVALLMVVVACVVLVFVNVLTGKELSDVRANLARCKEALTDLRRRTRDAESQRDSANRENRELRKEVASLLEQRKEDSFVIEQLWRGQIGRAHV